MTKGYEDSVEVHFRATDIKADCSNETAYGRDYDCREKKDRP